MFTFELCFIVSVTETTLQMSIKPSADVRSLRAARDLSNMLGCDLDDTTLSIITELLEVGVEPLALARVVQDLKEQKARADAAAGARKPVNKTQWIS